MPRPATIAWVEPHLFRTLGVQAILGRTFADDDRAIGHVHASGAEVGPDTAPAVVLTFGAWQRLFAGNPGVVGREVRVNRIPRVVIGVLAPDFVGPKNGMEGVDFYFAFDLRAAIEQKSGVRFHYSNGLDHTLNIGLYFARGTLPAGHQGIFEFIREQTTGH